MRLNEAKNILSKHLLGVGDETVPLPEAVGRICAKNILSPCDMPQWPISAMDGFAVRFGAKKEYTIVGQLNAGDENTFHLGTNQALRINTGAVVPETADAVIKIEDIEFLEETRIKSLKPVKKGENIIKRGENAKKGSMAIRRGQILSAAEVSTLRSFGRFSVSIKQRPTVGILNTGDELLDSPPIPRGKIIESNSIMLTSMLRSNFCNPLHFGSVLDNYENIRNALQQLLRRSEVLLLVGGTSKGTRDLIPKILDEIGTRLFKGLDISPGKPIGAWMVNETPIFSLPGYPVACYLTFRYIVRPYILESLGLNPFDLKTSKIQAILDETITSRKGRLQFVRVRLEKDKEGIKAFPVSKYGASNIISLTMADGILIIPEETTEVVEGTEVMVEMIRQPFL